MATFSERLRQLRNSKDITLEKLADDLETTKATLSRYENNMREPKVDFLEKAANYFNVTVDYLLGRVDNPNIEIMELNIDGHDYKIGIDKAIFMEELNKIQNSEKTLMVGETEITESEITKLIEKLKESRFDIEGLIKDIKENK